MDISPRCAVGDIVRWGAYQWEVIEFELRPNRSHPSLPPHQRATLERFQRRPKGRAQRITENVDACYVIVVAQQMTLPEVTPWAPAQNE